MRQELIDEILDILEILHLSKLLSMAIMRSVAMVIIEGLTVCAPLRHDHQHLPLLFMLLACRRHSQAAADIRPHHELRLALFWHPTVQQQEPAAWPCKISVHPQQVQSLRQSNMPL